MIASNASSRAAAIAANRFGLGARPGDLQRIGSDAPGWLAAQLRAGAPLLAASGLRSSQSVLREAIELRGERAAQRRASRAAPAADDSGDDTQLVAVAIKVAALYRPIYIQEMTARFAQGVATERSFVERLTHFWSNHFAVSIDKIAVLGLAGAMEREAIRPQVLGTFPQLLLAVETHPAMLLYLDNHLSIGANSTAARFLARRGGNRKIGINENLAREILELHTLGVDGGYTQQDVTTFAQVISGWSIGGPIGRGNLDGGEAGAFHFREAFHEPGSKTLLGRRFTSDGFDQGKAVLQELALRPQTARHLATKLARHFIADEPPLAAVERLTQAYLDSRGDLPTLYRALLDSPQAWEQPLAKFKTPSDYIHSSFRALGVPVDDSRRALQPFEVLGQRNLAPGSPAGWPDRSADWDGSSAVLKRVEWADAAGQRLGASRNARELADAVLGGTLSDATRTAIARADSGAQALTLLLASPEFMRR